MTTNFDAVMERIAGKLDQHGFTERDASMQATGKPDLIRDMKRRRGLPNSERLSRLAALLGTTSDWLLNGGREGEAEERAAMARTRVGSEVIGTGMSAHDVETAWRSAEPSKPVPLVGSAIGGELDDQFELTELHLGEVLDYLARPPSVANDKDAYAVTIVGESMAPRFEPGEKVFVSPRATVGIGDDVIVQLKGCGEEDDADRITMVLIKRLVKKTSDFVELRQFNPDTNFKVPADRVAAIHRVRGRL